MPTPRSNVVTIILVAPLVDLHVKRCVDIFITRTEQVSSSVQYTKSCRKLKLCTYIICPDETSQLNIVDACESKHPDPAELGTYVDLFYVHELQLVVDFTGAVLLQVYCRIRTEAATREC